MNNNSRWDNEQPFRPVVVGEALNVEIDAVGEKGDGICKRKGFVLFVPNVSKGDKVKIKVTKILSKVGFAEVVGEVDGPLDSDGANPQGNRQRRGQYLDESSIQQKQEEEVEQIEDSEDFGEELEELEEEVDDDSKSDTDSNNTDVKEDSSKDSQELKKEE